MSNHLVVAGAVAAILTLTFGVHPQSLGLAEGIAAALLGFGALLVFYTLGLMGAADVKFAAALGLWIGLLPLLWVWIGASLLAAVHGLALMAWRAHSGAVRTRKREIPYAAHMAVVTMGWLVWQHYIA